MYPSIEKDLFKILRAVISRPDWKVLQLLRQSKELKIEILKSHTKTLSGIKIYQTSPSLVVHTIDPDT